LSQILEHEQVDHDNQIHDLEKQSQDLRARIQQAVEQAHIDQKAQEHRFREERARFKAQFDGLMSEQEAAGGSGKEAVSEKVIQIEQLEEQLRQQAVAHETRKRELIHAATQKSRTLQDMLQQLEAELKAARAQFPQDLKAKENAMAEMNQRLA